MSHIHVRTMNESAVHRIYHSPFISRFFSFFFFIKIIYRHFRTCSGDVTRLRFDRFEK